MHPPPHTLQLCVTSITTEVSPFQTFFKKCVIFSIFSSISAFQLCVTSITADVEPHSLFHFDCILILYIPIPCHMRSY